MDFNQYQKKSKETADYPEQGKNFVYPTLGLTGEAGEVAEKLKKLSGIKMEKLMSKQDKKLKKN